MHILSYVVQPTVCVTFFALADSITVLALVMAEPRCAHSDADKDSAAENYDPTNYTPLPVPDDNDSGYNDDVNNNADGDYDFSATDVEDVRDAVSELGLIVPVLVRMAKKTLQREASWTKSVPGLARFVIQVMDACTQMLNFTENVSLRDLNALCRIQCGRRSSARRRRVTTATTTIGKRRSARIASLVRKSYRD